MPSNLEFFISNLNVAKSIPFVSRHAASNLHQHQNSYHHASDGHMLDRLALVSSIPQPGTWQGLRPTWAW